MAKSRRTRRKKARRRPRPPLPLLPRQPPGRGQRRPRRARQVLRQARHPRRAGRRGRRCARRSSPRTRRARRWRHSRRTRAATCSSTACERFRERFEELALALCIEAGKPIKDARGEVTRLIDTFRIAADEATRIGGEVIELEISERTRGYRGMVKRVPIGAVLLHHAVQLPAQPGRAQGRAGDRRRLPVRAQAGAEDADRRADHRRGAGGDRPAQGRVLGPAVHATTTPRCWSRTSASRCSASPAA